ncbi:acetyltransferase [Faunimonas pinastri]|uniref:Acetyltransferase n=1 Tax=Faunimonas pinastri TaxID=1855383 RepID=A0A1H8ZFB2_9HYPH|nr:bifunctional acetate--CoA ligase family protein/GNAT family N-acetyltransferase [Faunimonas pinastri]SEP63041.1 acetyltransferase [Faunimonas pinastri]
MTTRNFDALFQPRSIALIGASNRPGSVGSVLARNLLDSGFHGPILTVNPHEEAIRSTLNYRTIADLPMAPDLAVIATPAPTVPGIIDELGARGCRAAVVISAGFGGSDPSGPEYKQAMLDNAAKYLMRIVGPNCIGFISPGHGMNASFVHLTPKAGDLAFVSQSGAIASSILDWAAARGIGFSHVASLGDMSDVDFGDLLDYLATDRATRAILLYVENVTNARKFMSAARIAARSKPVIVIKSGRSAAGAKAALSHTGALAGSDAVYDAAFRRAGMLRVIEMRELFEAVATLSTGIHVRGDRLTILTNGGGAGVLATDMLEELGGHLDSIKPETVAALSAGLPASWSHANPVDILGDAPGERYERALETLLTSERPDAVLVMKCPTAVADSLDGARAVVRTLADRRDVPVLTCWLGELDAAPSRALFAANRIPTYDTPDEAIRAFMHLVNYRRNQELLMQTPASTEAAPPDRETVRGIFAEVKASGRTVLTEPEAKAVLKAYGVPTVQTATVTSPAEAADKASEIGFPVVLKILSPDITHKSDVGGVQLDLTSAEMVREAAGAMLAAVAKVAPDAHITGFTVQQMIDSSGAHELILGVAQDQTFGPILLFGQGGTAAELIADRAIGLPPLNMVLAREMIGRTRVSRLLGEHRGRPATDTDAIASTLVKLSELICDFPDLAELDINPLVADENGVIALDARVVVRQEGAAGSVLAIRPYPSELEKALTLNGGRSLSLRPIRPEDEPALVRMVEASSPEDVRLRFMSTLKAFPHMMAARLSQIDYDREMAFVAIVPGAEGGEILGVSRFIADPNNDSAEFGIMVRSDQKGQGLGYRLMLEILDYARKRGIRSVWGDILTENVAMLRLAGDLGFTRKAANEDGVVQVTIDLTRVPAGDAGGAEARSA